MHDYDVFEDLYKNYEIHVPWVRGSGPKDKANMAQSENVHLLILNFIEFSSLL